ATPAVAVAPQYDSIHVYVASQDFERFVQSFIGTFGGHSSKAVMVTVTPTPSRAIWQFLQTPVGALSVFGYKTPIPYPFGDERTGYLVRDMDVAVATAKSSGALVLVTPFRDAIGRDAIIEWPGGIETQLYWHTTAPSYAALQTIPENRVYLPEGAVDAFTRSFLAFSHGEIVSDDARAPGIEIGRAGETYRRIRIRSNFGKLTVLVSNGQLSYPYGRETTGYQVANVTDTIAKAKTFGATVLAGPYTADGRTAAIIEFPGGYVAEIHSAAGK
ncbi:MAG TPA: hypothetical protein VMF56_14715, partial [Acidobacteriaceae bacterium]|nr:hypothetical protein [Acidobacteriaceae bacterium]